MNALQSRQQTSKISFSSLVSSLDSVSYSASNAPSVGEILNTMLDDASTPSTSMPQTSPTETMSISGDTDNTSSLAKETSESNEEELVLDCLDLYWHTRHRSMIDGELTIAFFDFRFPKENEKKSKL